VFRLRAEGRGPTHRFGRYAVLPQSANSSSRANPLRSANTPSICFLLIEQRQRVVSRKELADLVWPDRVVDDDTLAGQLRELQAARRDLIATVPGRGYRFVPLRGGQRVVRIKT
jgi:DNA-binding response OmpR family regulator